MLWAIYCVDGPDMAKARAEHRPAHLEHLKANGDIIVLSGATLSDDGATATGSLFIVNVDSRAEAKAFSDGDAFTKAGIFKSVTITRMRKGHWHPENAEGA